MSRVDQESRAGLFRRARYLRHSEMAARNLRLRGHRVLRRSRARAKICKPIKAKAQKLGVKKVYVEDLRETFVKDYVFPMLRGNAMYEGCLSAGHLDRAAADCPPSG